MLLPVDRLLTPAEAGIVLHLPETRIKQYMRLKPDDPRRINWTGASQKDKRIEPTELEAWKRRNWHGAAGKGYTPPSVPLPRKRRGITPSAPNGNGRPLRSAKRKRTGR